MCERRCSDCDFLLVISKEERNRGRNRAHYVEHGICICNHMDAKFLSGILTTGKTEPGVIALAREDNTPEIKTAPRWCPLEAMEYPVRITKRQAYKIIEKGSPKGLFCVDEGKFWTAFDNRFEDAAIEEFQSIDKCKKWLLDRAKKIVNPGA